MKQTKHVYQLTDMNCSDLELHIYTVTCVLLQVVLEVVQDT